MRHGAWKTPPRSIWLLLCLLAGILRCAPAPVDITLLAFSDFHGALGAPRLDATTGRPRGGAEALAATVQAERLRSGQPTFLFEAGDAWQGTPESNFFFGRTTGEYLNRLGVDAAALGNHEFDWGVDTLQARLAEASFLRLAANVFERDGSASSWCPGWTLIERQGVRLGVIGFITPETPRVTLPQNVAHLRFADPETQLDSLVALVRGAGADVVVLLCHLGADRDSTGAIAGPLAALAARCRGVDAIIGGHTHTRVAGHVAGIPLVIAGSKGSDLGKIVLRWDGRRVVSSEAQCMPVFADSLSVPVDAAVQGLVDSVRALTRPRVRQVLAQAPRRLGLEDLASFIAEAMRLAASADVAVTNLGGVRTELGPGAITVGDVYELVPFENSLVTARLTGEQLRRFLQSSQGAARVRGLYAAGAGGLPAIDPEGSYAVVTNNFLALGGDGFRGFLEGSQVTWLDLQVRDVVQRAFLSAAGPGGVLDLDGEIRVPAPARP